LRYGHPGFAVYEIDGRLWVFASGSEALQDFLESGEPAKRITRVGVGPDGKTVISDEGSTIDAYLASTRYAASGYQVEMKDGRLWVFAHGSKALADYRKHGDPAKRVTRVGAGPDGRTVIGPDTETLDGYVTKTRYAASGYHVEMKDGRLWVFAHGSKAIADYRKHGEPAKRITRVGAGPDGKTVIGPDHETLDGYIAKARYGVSGFAVFLVDGRLWVFREGSADLAEYQRSGEPAKRITLVGAGPDGKTVIGPDRATVDAYVAAAPR
jgi:hypothetical protein